MVKKKSVKSSGKSKSGSKAGLWIFAGIVVIVVIVLFFALSGKGGEPSYAAGEVDAFAQCLTEKGTVMYGAFWCPHCAKTKARFGNAFRYVTYVECDPRGDDEQSELCIEKGIENYDTWEFADGTRVVGEPSFETLAEKSGCTVPSRGGE